MSTEKFTPGEWEIEEPVKDDELRFNDGYNYRIWGGNKKHRHSLALVLCNGRPGDTNYPQNCFAESKANAHLIAAAPEMYRMLKYLADGIRWGGIQHTDRSLSEKIDKLLKKAKGEEKE